MARTLTLHQIWNYSLDSIPSTSPSVKIQIIGEKVISQNIDGWCQQTSFFQKFVGNAQQCFAFTPQTNFPARNLNFCWRWRWWDHIQATFWNIFYSISCFVFLGYGNIAPVTTAGRVFCLLFAIVGIPFTLSVIADVGQIFATLLLITLTRNQI